MRMTTAVRTACAVGVAMTLALILATVTAVAQEGHPLTGTWYGDYTVNGQKRDLTVMMKWGNGTVTGTVNPGAGSTPLKAAVLNIVPGVPAPEGQNSVSGKPPVFNVHMEMDLPKAGGGTERVTFEGTIQNPVAVNRSITGTWTSGTAKGPFAIRRL